MRDRARSDPAGDHPVICSAATGRVPRQPERIVTRPFHRAVRSYRSHKDPGPPGATDPPANPRHRQRRYCAAMHESCFGHTETPTFAGDVLNTHGLVSRRLHGWNFSGGAATRVTVQL
jgi:hypothetical protein